MPNPSSLAMEDAIRQAVLAERAACAKIADIAAEVAKGDRLESLLWRDCARTVADNIRRRPPP